MHNSASVLAQTTTVWSSLLQQLLESHKRQEVLLEQICSLLQSGQQPPARGREFQRAKARRPSAGSVNDAE